MKRRYGSRQVIGRQDGMASEKTDGGGEGIYGRAREKAKDVV